MQTTFQDNYTLNNTHGPRARSLLTGKAPFLEFVPPAPLDDEGGNSGSKGIGRREWERPSIEIMVSPSDSMRRILSLSPIALSQELGQRRLLAELHEALQVLTPHVALTTEAETALDTMNRIIQKLQQHAEQLETRVVKQTILEEPNEDDDIDVTESSETSAPIRVIRRPRPEPQLIAPKALPPAPMSAPQYTLYVHEKTPKAEVFDNITLHRGTYGANKPSEDRSTVVVGQDFLWCGVWDGHGGPSAAHFAQKHVFDHFRQARDQGSSLERSFQTAFANTDRAYYQFVTGLQKNNNNNADQPQTPAVYFAGTCAIACYIDIRTGSITCANLGDSRAVAGVWNEDAYEMETVELSTDHSANQPIEQERLRAQHPHDKTVLIQEEYGDDTSWRVKGIAAFTRSIGDLHLKEKNTAALFNSYVPPQQRIYPRPGIKDKETGIVKPKYISTEPDVRAAVVPDGFLIVASDGVWDEMSSDQAVQTVAKLLKQYDSAQHDIAALFIKEVLKRVVQRISTEHEDEKDLTLSELKARPAGKCSDRHRAMLHDDITVIIVQLGRDKQILRQFAGSWSTTATETCHSDTVGEMEMSMSDLMSDHPEVCPNTPLKEQENGSNLNNSGKWHNSMSSSFSLLGQSVGNIWGWLSQQRQSTDKQILRMMSAFDDLQTKHLQMLFSAVDADENGTLDREEITRLIKHVIQMDVTPAVVDLAFTEMDRDGSGDVDFEEFSQFFGR